MISIKEKIVKELQLNDKLISCELSCYRLASKRYIIFWPEEISKVNIQEVLNQINICCNNSEFSKWKSIIVLGITKDEFTTKELLYFDGVSNFVNFYLINPIENKYYMNKDWIFVLGLNFKKYVKKINRLLHYTK